MVYSVDVVSNPMALILTAKSLPVRVPRLHSQRDYGKSYIPAAQTAVSLGGSSPHP